MVPLKIGDKIRVELLIYQRVILSFHGHVSIISSNINMNIMVIMTTMISHVTIISSILTTIIRHGQSVHHGLRPGDCSNMEISHSDHGPTSWTLSRKASVLVDTVMGKKQ